MLEINSSNEYRVALEMYQESVELLNKLSSEMTDFFKDLGYNVLIIYNDESGLIKAHKIRAYAVLCVSPLLLISIINLG